MPWACQQVAYTRETLPDECANGDVVSVATAVVPPTNHPALAELRTPMQAVPVQADDICQQLSCHCRLGELLHDHQLLHGTATEDMNATASPVDEIGKLMRQLIGVATQVAEDDIVGTSTGEITQITDAIHNIGAEIGSSEMMRRHHVQPFDHFFLQGKEETSRAGDSDAEEPDV